MEKTASEIIPPKQSTCRCCYGLAYFSRAMQENGKTPTCFGVRARKEGDIVIDSARELSASHADFKYYCMGFSVYPDGSTAASVDPDAARLLPYCEGIEDTSGQGIKKEHQPPLRRNAAEGRLDASTAAAAAAAREALQHQASEASTSTNNDDGSSNASPTAKSRLLESMKRNAERMRASLSGELPSVITQMGSAQELQQRFLQVASQNVQKVSSAAAMVGNTLYSATLKRLLEGSGSAGDESGSNR